MMELLEGVAGEEQAWSDRGGCIHFVCCICCTAAWYCSIGRPFWRLASVFVAVAASFHAGSRREAATEGGMGRPTGADRGGARHNRPRLRCKPSISIPSACRCRRAITFPVVQVPGCCARARRGRCRGIDLSVGGAGRPTRRTRAGARRRTTSHAVRSGGTLHCGAGARDRLPVVAGDGRALAALGRRDDRRGARRARRWPTASPPTWPAAPTMPARAQGAGTASSTTSPSPRA